MHNNLINKASECVGIFDVAKPLYEGQEPWSSGYGEDSCSEGHGFESQHFKLAGHFSQFILLKNVCLKRRKNEKEAGDGPSLKKTNLEFSPSVPGKCL